MADKVKILALEVDGITVENVAILLLEAGSGGEARDDLAQVSVLGDAILEFAVEDMLMTSRKALHDAVIRT